MRRKITYLALALLVPLGFTACSQEEDFSPQEQEIRVAFTIDAIKTRVNTLDTVKVRSTERQNIFLRKRLLMASM